MRPIPTIPGIISLLAAVVFFISCGHDIDGRFYLSEVAHDFMADTTITSFIMEDSYGIRESFVQSPYWYSTHHYFDEWGIDKTAFGEVYGIAWYSTLNNYMFMYSLRASLYNTDFETEWNQSDRMVYNLYNMEIESGRPGQVSFYDTLKVRGVLYHTIMEVDYSGCLEELDHYTPKRFFISGDKGLIRFINQDGNVVERVADPE